jgi:HD-like signal output (HDOD) protein
VRNLVIGNGMVAAFRDTPGMNLKQFWTYNLYTACASRWLAGKGGASADLIFTLGLMHGIGQLQLHAALPEAMVALDKEMNVLDAGRADLEKRELGFHYGDVSSKLAEIWNFPQALILALREVPQPLSAPEFSAPAAWVHMGAWRARTEMLAMTDEEIIASYPGEVGKRLGIAPTWVPALAKESEGGAAAVMPPIKEFTEGLDAMLN